jgi:WXXGXW repeat (2 copies)
MHNLKASALAIMLGASSVAALSLAANAQVSVDVSVNIAPPPLPFYQQPQIPEEGYLWAPGYWAWDNSEADYYWVPGTWVQAPEPSLLWTPAYWGWSEGKYVFYTGYWAPQVGFYGGVDYGYGYGGEGYEGGHWDHGAFFYNRAANNIANITTKNVYNQTIVVNNSNRVSFDGGDGGIQARPTEQQQALAKDKHVEATPAQKQHMEAASKDHALYSKQNHGVPEVAATARPGDLQGAGVTHATKSNANEPPKPASDSSQTGADKKPESPAGSSTGKEPLKAEAQKKLEKPSPAGEMKKEEPKVEPAQKSEKPAPSTEMKREPPKAESPTKQEKSTPTTQMKREESKSEPVNKQERPAPATEMRKEPPKAQPAMKSEKPTTPMGANPANSKEEKKAD